MDQLDTDIATIWETIGRLRTAYDAATDLQEQLQLLQQLNGSVSAYIRLLNQWIARANELHHAAHAVVH